MLAYVKSIMCTIFKKTAHKQMYIYSLQWLSFALCTYNDCAGVRSIVDL